jgi:predicted small lipoprotein YifL
MSSLNKMLRKSSLKLVITLLFSVWMSASLSGCGQKGPLQLPQEKPADNQA